MYKQSKKRPADRSDVGSSGFRKIASRPPLQPISMAPTPQPPLPPAFQPATAPPPPQFADNSRRVTSPRVSSIRTVEQMMEDDYAPYGDQNSYFTSRGQRAGPKWHHASYGLTASQAHTLCLMLQVRAAARG